MSPFAALRSLSLVSLSILILSANPLKAATWLPYGPDGGDARSLAADPGNHAHLYLGTATGWIYESMDSGGRWKRLAQIGKRDDLVLDNIEVDPTNSKHLLVGAWVLDHPDGGLFQSIDGGVTWTDTADLKGQSIRSLAIAPSDPKTIGVGTLKGVYRSSDSGGHWERISPVANAEIHNVESLAFDPQNPEVAYAGTWHLPWKTMDGGKTWASIKQGVIDDSDVFSIIVNPKDPKIVFVSACSGIYKSEDKAALFHKIQGIPNTARRTRVLMQDPGHMDTVFAGTTEGLWKTTDAGKNWLRMTGPEVIVNDVFVDPTDSQKVLLATDRGGVLTSADGGASFTPANGGFSARQITAVLSDATKVGAVYAGVVNDKTWGGVFASEDGGLNWKQQSEGLSGRDVFSLGQSPDGSVLAGTGHGLYRYEGGAWTHATTTVKAEEPVPAVARKPLAKKGKTSVTETKAPPAIAPGKRVAPGAVPVATVTGGDGSDAFVYAVAATATKTFAGTSAGMLVSDVTGRSWELIPAMTGEDWRLVAGSGQTILAASLTGTMISVDDGATWTAGTVPSGVKRVNGVAVDSKGELWLGAREGVFLSTDRGATWQGLQNLYVPNVDSLFYDTKTDQLLVTAGGSATMAFVLHVADRKTSWVETGWTLRTMRVVGDHFLGTTLFDGVVIQPRMLDIKEVAKQ